MKTDPEEMLRSIMAKFDTDEKLVVSTAYGDGGTYLLFPRLARAAMYGYQNPGPKQTTNIKGNGFIRGLASSGKEVEIHALPDNGLLHYGGFHVNLAAGLEDSIVSTLKPAWNKMGI